jgi:hypothetical protein
MKPEEALEDIRGYALAGRMTVSPHAAIRMRERGVTFSDIRHAIKVATVCVSEPDGRWRVDGEDFEGDPLTLVVALEYGLIVVTLF